MNLGPLIDVLFYHEKQMEKVPAAEQESDQGFWKWKPLQLSTAID